MRAQVIHKSVGALAVRPDLADYDAGRERFSWEAVRRQLGVAAADPVNIARLALDRHRGTRLWEKTALRFLARDGRRRDFKYWQLAGEVRRFASVLRGLGVGRGDRVFVLAGRIPAMHIAILGALGNGSVVTPLSPGFGPEAIGTHLALGEGKVLVTTEALYARKVAAIAADLPHLAHVVLVGEAGARTSVPGTHDWARLMAEASDAGDFAATAAEDIALLHFTRGTTGTPKGALHVHEAAIAHYATAASALDLHPDDVFWCTADPSQVTGTSYGIVAPLMHGVTSIVDEADFDAERCYRVLHDEAITVWCTAPAAIRMLMQAGPDLPRRYRFAQLRFIASVGEPLDPEALRWGEEALGLPIHDNWWQTETGGIVIADTPAVGIRPGSMGRALPGFDAVVVMRREDGTVEDVAAPGVEGELALRAGWPSMFRGYLNQEERYRKCFCGPYYLTGDLAKRDADGYFWFVGRATAQRLADYHGEGQEAARCG
jgi:acetyl-CoA synthetase